MSFKTRLFAKPTYDFEDERIFFRTKAAMDISLYKVLTILLMPTILLILLIVVRFDLVWSLIIIIGFPIGTLILFKKTKMQKSFYLITDTMLYAYERNSMFSASENAFLLEDIYSINFEYESRMFNTGYITISDYRGRDYPLNTLPIKNLDGFIEIYENLEFVEEG